MPVFSQPVSNMEQMKWNPILKFNKNQLSEVRVALGYEDVNKLKQDIKQLDDWIKKQNHFNVKNFDVNYLERFLIYNKGSIERTKQKLDKLCTCINLMPEFFQNFDIKNEFVHMFNVANVYVLPKPTKENYRVFITNAVGKDDSDFYLTQYYRYWEVIFQYMLNNDYCLGYEIILDTRKVTFANMGKINPVVIHKALVIMTNIRGQRIKRIHLISGSKYFNSVLYIVKQALAQKLKERVVIHHEVQSLYEYIPREHLPLDFGGDEKSVQEISDKNFKELSSDSHMATVKFTETASTNESRRLVSKFNEEYSGMPGSFKTLCVD